MAKITSVSREEVKHARMAGFKKKKPKKPKTKTENSLTSYVERYNEWAKDLKVRAKEGKRLDDLRKSVRKA